MAQPDESVPAPERRRFRIHLGWLTLALLPFLLVLLTAELGRTFFPWPKPVPGVRLEPLLPPLRDADVTPDNAFHYIRQLKAPEGQDGHGLVPDGAVDRLVALGWPAGDSPELAAFEKAQAGNVALLRQAAAQPRAQVADADRCQADLGYLWRTYAAAQALSIAARRAAAEGRWESVAADVRVMLRAGHVAGHGGGWYHNQLEFYWCDPLPCTLLRDMALGQGGVTPPPAFLHEMLAALEATEAEALAEPLGEWARWQRRVSHDLALAVYADPAGAVSFERGCIHCPRWSPELFPGWCVLRRTLVPVFGGRLRRTCRHLDVLWSRVLSEADASYYTGALADGELTAAPQAKDPATRRERWLPQLIGDDPPARWLAEAVIPDPDDAQQDRFKALAQFRGTRLVLALRLWQAAHDGRPPDRLEALAPALLARVPDDPFAPPGTPFRYEVGAGGGWSVWSRGPDRADDERRLDYELTEDDRGDIIFASSEPAERKARYMSKPAVAY